MTPRLLAIVPAAGKSRRMGQPKLLLELAGQTVIARVVQALREAGVSRTLVVIRSSDDALIRESQLAGAEVVLPPSDPQEMRQSVECALRYLREEAPPAKDARHDGLSAPCDGWVLVPADHPTLNPLVIQQLIAAWSIHPQMIAVPVFQGRRGHPTIFPWSLEQEVRALPDDQGLNQLLRTKPERVLEVNISDSQILDDLDTPADFRRLLQRIEGDSASSAE